MKYLTLNQDPLQQGEFAGVHLYGLHDCEDTYLETPSSANPSW